MMVERFGQGRQTRLHLTGKVMSDVVVHPLEGATPIGDHLRAA